MSKLMNAVAALALTLFATGALAADNYLLSVDGAKVYAKEIFGEGSGDLAIDYARGSEPTLTITMVKDSADPTSLVPATDDVAAGETAEITISLSNAQFAENVSGNDLRVYLWVADTNALTPASSPDGIEPGATTDPHDIDVDVAEDGGKGDSSVTFEVTTTAGNTIPARATVNVPVAEGTDTVDESGMVAPAADFVFSLPELTALDPDKSVTATVVIEGGVGGDAFPSSDDVMGAAAQMGMTGTKVDDDGVLQPIKFTEAGREPSTNVPLVSYANALTLMAEGGSSTDINIANRVGFTWPYQAYMASIKAGVAETTVLQSDGSTFDISPREEGAGEVMVTVYGDFRSGDTAFLDLNGNHQPADDEELTVDAAEGMATGRFALIDIAGDSGSADARQKEQGVASRNLIYRGNGKDPLRPAEFRTKFRVDFDERTNADRDAAGGMRSHRTSYSTIESTDLAYAIPPLSSTDKGNIRIKCEVSSECTVYLECDEADGSTHFAMIDDPINGWATLHLQSPQVADILGVDDWTGRLSCSVLSTRAASVQVLTRSGDALVNNTYVDQ